MTQILNTSGEVLVKGKGTVKELLTDAAILGTSLNGARLINMDLPGINLENARLSNANFSGTNLDEVNLKYAKMNNALLQGTNLSNSSLNFANLECAHLVGATLVNTSLANTFMRGTYLGKVNLKGIKNYYDSREIFHELVRRLPSQSVTSEEWGMVGMIMTHSLCWVSIHRRFRNKIVPLFEMIANLGFNEYLNKYEGKETNDEKSDSISGIQES